MFMLFFLGWKTSLAFSVCTAAGQNSWSEDMKPTERGREKAGCTLPLTFPAGRRRNRAPSSGAWAQQRKPRSCETWRFLLSHLPPPQRHSSRPRPHLSPVRLCCWRDWFLNAVISIFTRVFNATSWRTCPLPIVWFWPLQNGRLHVKALRDNVLISSPQRTWCQSDKR